MVSRMGPSVVFSLALAGLCVWAGCGGGPGGGGGGDTTGPLTATVDAADAVTESFHQACDSAPWPGGAEAFVAAAEANAEVVSVSVDETTGDASVRYRSGVVHILHHCDSPETETGTTLDSLLDSGAVRDLSAHPVTTRWFPSQDTPAATAAASYDENGLYTAIQQACQRVLDSYHVAGYQVPSAVPTATIDWFRNWGNCGVIYFTGHGGWGRWPTDAGDVPIYALQTAERYEAADGPNPAWAEDLAEGRMVFLSVDKTGDHVEDVRAMAVTRRFFEHYCNPMASHGIVWLNSCDSLTYYTDLAASLCDMGTELVLGWRGPAPVRRATAWSLWALDRMSGLNVTHPLDPPTRPFTADDVWRELDRRGWTRYVSPQGDTSDLEYFRPTSADDERTALCPVISGGVFHPETESSRANVWLNGYFGRTRGQILVDETPLTIAVW
ncbi:MAG TPA: hypothetical protein PLQ54_18930, partial [Armatimonadota bacterium]|nr:hypothetical protein [Armatimonadota bacterium]